MSKNYKATVAWCNKDLSARAKIAIKDTADAKSLDKVVTPAEALLITVDTVAEIAVHNEDSENKDYAVYVLIDTDGNKYTTSSDNFFRTLSDIMDELNDSGDEGDLDIKILKKPSKNYEGRSFLTCTLA